MERSQSCSNFETSVNTKTALIRNFLEYAALEQTNSQEDLSSTLSSNKNREHFPNGSISLRRKTFQRQRSATFSDDTDYAGDMEEEDDDEDDDNQKSPKTSRVQQAQNPPNRHRSQYQPTLPPQPEIGFISNVTTHHVALLSSSTIAFNQANHLPRNKHSFRKDESFDSSSTAGDHSLPSSPGFKFTASTLLRDNSIHSDSSRYSSVDSLLEARKPDPEAILINLGFGPVGTDDILSRIPKRFLKPSQVRGNDTEAFVKRLQLANNLADHSALGYRGLTGNPDIPPSSIVAKIMQRFEVNERKKSMGSIEHTI